MNFSRTIFILFAIGMMIPFSFANATPDVIRPIIDLNDGVSKESINVETNPDKQSPLVDLLVTCPTGLIAYEEATTYQIATVCIVADPEGAFETMLTNTLGQTLDVSVDVDNLESKDDSSSSGSGSSDEDEDDGDSSDDSDDSDDEDSDDDEDEDEDESD